MAPTSVFNKNSQVFKLADYIASSHLSFDVFDTIQRVFLLSNKVSSVLISVDDDSVIGISSSIIADTKQLTPDTKIEVVSYNDWRKDTSETFAYDYDRSRFARSTLLETLRYKVRDHQRYSFVAHKLETLGQESVVKYTFISLGKDAKFILATQQEITHNLEHDVLTGGLNRSGLLRELQTKIEMFEPTTENYILYFNIQNFRLINEFYGDEIGDKVLQYFYTQLVYSALSPISYARMESDKFVCLVRKEYYDTDVISQLCHQEFVTDQMRIPFQCLCGVCPIKDSLVAPINVINRAKLAMSYINDQYIKPWMIFEDYMQSSFFSDNEILQSFDQAVANNEFVPYFQPIVDARTGRIEMAEALVRWVSQKHGVVSPTLFIPILERHGGLSRIDMLMESRIVEMQRRRMSKGQPVIPIDINLSWVDFSDKKFVEQLFRHIEEHSLPNNLVRYEITETALSDIAENRLDVLAFFKKHGIDMLIDDFGQGYSFGTMKDVDFSFIKLDKSLIDQIGNSNKVNLLIETLINMFHKMGAKIIAEGVETDIQVNYLRKVGCDYIQGFYFYKPMDENAFLALLEQQQIAWEYNQMNFMPQESFKSLNNWMERDVLEKKYASLKQSDEEAKCLRMLLDEQDIYIFEWDIKTHIDKVPEKFRKMYNLPSTEIPNMPEIADLCVPEDRDRFREFYYRAARGERMGTDYFRLYSPDGKSYSWFRKTFYTLYDAEGFPYKAILAMQNYGDKYKLRLSKRRELMLTKDQDILTFIYYVHDDTLRFNYLNSEGEVVSHTFKPYLNSSLANDTIFGKLATIFKQKLEDKEGPRNGYIDFYNNFTKTEQRAHYAKIDGEYGHLYAIIGQAEDINRTKERLTETIKTQNELLDMTESLRSIYNAIAYVNLKERSSRIVILDKAYNGVLSTKMQWYTIARMYVDRLIRPQYHDAFLEFMNLDTMNERIGSKTYISMEYEDSVVGWIRGFLIPSSRDEEGNIVSVLFASQAIGEEKSTMERLTYLSEIDSLTQIRNRYSGMRDISKSLQNGKPGLFGILDSDKFKFVNDNYGHIVGDNVLKCIAEGLSKMNPDGINMRLGGDEFAFFIEGDFTDDQIHQQLNVLFDYLNEFRFTAESTQQISVSVGVVAIHTSNPISIDEAYRRGDALLYQSKKTFGNAMTIEHVK